jgi:hypothetical protein
VDVTPIRCRGRLGTVLAVAGLAALFPARSASAQEALFDILPLAPGNTWSYEGTVWWVPRNSRRVLEERVELEMRVVNVVERAGVRAALLAGYPADLVTTKQDRFTGEFGLLQIASSVYLVRGDQAREALRRVADPSDSLADLLLGSEIVLDLPLAEGRSFCSPRDESRRGPGTCWFVRGEGPVQRMPVARLKDAAAHRGFVLALESRTEHEVRGFVPGIGFTSFAIGNFGDPSALELELVDARIAVPARHAPGVFLKTLDLSDGQRIEMGTASDRLERLTYAATAKPDSPAANESPVAEDRPAVSSPARGGSSPEDEPARVARAVVREPTSEAQTGSSGTAPGASGTASGASETPPAAIESPPVSVEPPPNPFPSPDRLLPERRMVRTDRPSRPIAIEVAREELPVPVWEDTRPACLDARDWYAGGAPIQLDGREFDPVGSAEPIDPDNLVDVGEFDGVPAFAGRLSETPHTDLWLPLCGTPGTYRLYADLSVR